MNKCRTCGTELTGHYHIDCNHSCVEYLKSQLEEAREKIDIQKGHLELAISISDDSNIKLLCTALLEKIKEKGDE